MIHPARWWFKKDFQVLWRTVKDAQNREIKKLSVARGSSSSENHYSASQLRHHQIMNSLWFYTWLHTFTVFTNKIPLVLKSKHRLALSRYLYLVKTNVTDFGQMRAKMTTEWLSFSWKWSMSPLSITSGVYPCKWEAVTINRNQCNLVTSVITISGIWWFKLCPISPQNEMISLGRYLKSQKSSPEELDVHLQLQWAPWVPVRSKGEATNVFEVSCCSSIKSHYVSAIN